MAMLKNQRVYIYIYILAGWWYTYPSEKYEFVSWDDSFQHGKNKKKQPVYIKPYAQTKAWKVLKGVYWNVIYQKKTPFNGLLQMENPL